MDRLQPALTFDSFMVGPSNRFAHAAALAVAESPGTCYNPLLIYGAAGLGKTHLLHAIANRVREHLPAVRLRHVTCETVLTDFVDAIGAKTMVAFKRRYRDVDVLLVDDIQLLEGKEGLQEELFHTFNDLHADGRQIVLVSGRPPRNMSALEGRLRSRFEWGLIIDVTLPDFETRLAIVRRKAEEGGLAVPDTVLELLARRRFANVCQLEGALTRVAALASLNGEPITVGLAEEALGDLGVPPDKTLDTIIGEVAEKFGATPEELTGPQLDGPLAEARQVAMYLCRRYGIADAATARAFGTDVAGVVSAWEAIRAKIEKDTH